MDMDKKNKKRGKLPYKKPKVESDTYQERVALACGKLPPGQGTPQCKGQLPARLS